METGNSTFLITERGPDGRTMESKTASKDRFFIVIRGKSRKGFCRGCIGRVEAETARGELMGLMYGCGSNAGSPKNGGYVKAEDTYPLTRHQAQLLLYISSPSRRLELLCNPQLFSAICELSPGDLVTMKYKKGHIPGVVKNLMQIGKKENKEDLNMLGFEVEFEDSENHLSTNKLAPLPIFTASDIIQVVPSYSAPLGLQYRDFQSGGSSGKVVMRMSSMPNIRTSKRKAMGSQSERSVVPSQTQSTSPVPLEVGSLVEVVNNAGITVYGVIQWLGIPEGKLDTWAGIELDYEVKGCSDGVYKDQRYFTCKENSALFVPITKCSPDSRFVCSSAETETFKTKEPPPVPPYEDSEEDAPPVPESEATSRFVGKMKGIQGHINSCYLDATLFSLFSSSVTVDAICNKPADKEQPITCILKSIVNRLRRQGFVPAQSVMNFRKNLGCETFSKNEKDPEEFISVLFQKVLCIEPLLKLRSEGTSQGAYTLQIFLEKEQMGQTPTVQKLLDTSCMSSDIKFETMPSCLIIQMPRCGNKYKMFSHIIPSTELDITDLLYNSPRECFICGQMAKFECLQCLPDYKLQPGRIKQYCSTCSTQVHTHRSRCSHSPRALVEPAGVATNAPLPRQTMQLFGVLCIQTSHFVSYVKYGPDSHSWLFFDSMADRYGDDQNGYSIPEVQACPELGDFLCQPEEELTRANPTLAPELVRRLLCDSYMFLYHRPEMSVSKPNSGGP